MKNLSLLIKPAAGLCNMNCRYCFYKSACEGRENKIMTKRTVDELIQKIKAFSPSSLSVMFQGGEPTLAGLDFFEYFVRAVKKNVSAPVSFALQTNGLLIDDGYAKFFKSNDFLIGVSLDGGRGTNNRYRLDKNGKSVFAEVLSAISILKKHGVEFNILSVIDDKNASDIESSWNYFKKHDFSYLQFIPYVDEGNDISLSVGAYGVFLKRVYELWLGEFQKGNYISVRHIDNYINILMGNPPENCAMCGVCSSYFTVEANGDLYPCDFYCKEEYRLGNVYDENPFEINEKHRKFIEESYIIHKKCNSCKYYALCRGGCRRDRYNGFTENKYCESYKQFFDYAADSMALIARGLNNG